MSRAEDLYFAALERPTPTERAAFLDDECGTDLQLRRRIEKLLQAAEHVGAFLERPAIIVPSPETPYGLQHDTPPPKLNVSDRRDTSQRFQLFDEIGRGGMGMILRGHDTDLQRDIAVKVLLETHLGRDDLAERFLQEARVTGQLQHPGIVPIYHVGRFEDQRPYFAMKLVQGQTLAALLAGRSDPSHEQARYVGIFLQICQTLAYAHARGVIHRDLKPANIMVGEFGEVQVMDWGLAKKVHEPDDEDSTMTNHTSGFDTSPGVVIGTPAYLPPEQARHASDRNDPRSDVFGLGGILCEILTGAPPFRGKTARTMLALAHNNDLADAQQRLNVCDADPALIQIVLTCLESDPTKRPRDGGVVAEQIVEYQASVQERLHNAELERAATRARAEGERWRRWLAWGLVVAFILVGLSSGITLWYKQNERNRQQLLAAKTLDAMLHARSLLAKGWETQERNLLLEALAKGGEAFQISHSSNLDTELQQETQDLKDHIEDRLQRLERNRELLDTMLDTTIIQEVPNYQNLHHGPHVAVMTRNTDIERANAFHRWGLDINTTPQVTAVERLRAEPVEIQEDLIAALDQWAMERFERGQPNWKSLQELASSLDTNPTREQLRALLFQTNHLLPEVIGLWVMGGNSWSGLVNYADHQGATTYKKLRQTFQPNKNATHTNILMAGVCERFNDQAAAEQILRQAIVNRPDNAALIQRLGILFEKQGKRKYADALGCYRTARSLRPSLSISLCRILAALGSHAECDEAESILKKLLIEQPDDSGLNISLSQVYFSQRRYQDAEKIIKKLIDQEPNNLDYYIGLSHTYFCEERHKDMENAAITALRLDPNSAIAQCNKGLALQLQKNIPSAIAAYREALRHDPTHVFTLTNLGFALMEQYMNDQALASFNAALQKSPKFVPALLGIGIFYSRQAQWLQARIAFSRALEYEPNNSAVHNYLGVMLMRQGAHGEAERSFREAIKCDPTSYTPFLNLGMYLVRVQKFDEALEVHRAAVRLKPNAATYLALATTLDIRDEFAEAEATYRLALKEDPNSSVGLTSLASLLLRIDRTDEAATYSNLALKLDPNMAKSLSVSGMVAMKQKKHVEAIRILRTAIKFDPNDYINYHTLGMIYWEQGEFAAALASFDKAISIFRLYGIAYFDKARLLEMQQHFAEATKTYLAALRVMPTDYRIYARLSKIYQSQLYLKEAADYIQKAIQLNGKLPALYLDHAEILRLLGQFKEALAVTQKAQELARTTPGWTISIAPLVRTAEQDVELEKLLPKILTGEHKPKDMSEQMNFAQLCCVKGHHEFAVKIYEDIFKSNIKQDSITTINLLESATIAAIGASDRPQMKQTTEQARYRGLALRWLNEARQTLFNISDNGNAEMKRETIRYHYRWQMAPNFNSVRDSEMLKLIPADERDLWRKFWEQLSPVTRKNS